MKNTKRYIFILFVFSFFVAFSNIARADISLTVRDGDTKIFEGSVALPAAGTVDLVDTNGDIRSIDAESTLSVIHSADLDSDDFSITKLEYYSSFGSLYLKCIEGSTGEKCDDWQYTVDGEYPQEGADQKILSGSETVYLYFGPTNKITIEPDSINTEGTLAVTTQKYDYENNLWITRTGVTVGITSPNPDDPWSPIEIQTAPVDENGNVTFSSIPVGNYNVGVKEDFYFPTEELTVTEAPQKTSSGSVIGSMPSARTHRASTVIPPDITEEEFDQKKAFDFIISKQKEDGSFGEDIYTDWAALALAGNSDFKDAETKLFQYLATSSFSGTSLTDFERHAMALMALGLNPYGTNGQNYIQKILSSFDGKQFGDQNLYNDDIFALIVLSNTGFTIEDEVIKDTVSFVLEKQRADGSWGGSADMTGAAMVALSPFKETPEIQNVLAKAKGFLKQTQKDGGGFGNVSSTAWAMQGILALGEKAEDWKNKEYEKTPLDYIKENQNEDGSAKTDNEDNKLWDTSYLLASLSGKTWSEIMSKFPKQETIIKPKVVEKKPEIKTVAAVPAAKKEVKEKKPKIENTLTKNTAPATVVLSDVQKEEKGWFINLIEKIFGL